VLQFIQQMRMSALYRYTKSSRYTVKLLLAGFARAHAKSQVKAARAQTTCVFAGRDFPFGPVPCVAAPPLEGTSFEAAEARAEKLLRRPLGAAQLRIFASPY
jgi:hypothetical protein